MCDISRLIDRHAILFNVKHTGAVMSDKQTRKKKEKNKKLLRVWHLVDLGDAGYGSRATIHKDIKLGIFPPPLDDGNGRPIWTVEMLNKHDASLKLYHPEPISHIKKNRNGEMLMDTPA